MFWHSCYFSFGVMSCVFLRGHQLGGVSNWFDWYKMWKSCPGKPVCPCLHLKACRLHKSSVWIAITGCRLCWHLCLVTAGETLPPQHFQLSCRLRLPHHTERGVSVIPHFPLPTSCSLAPCHSAHYRNTQFTVCHACAGSFFPPAVLRLYNKRSVQRTAG